MLVIQCKKKIFDLRVLSRDFQNELIIHLGEKICTSLIALRLLFSGVTKLSLLVNSSIIFFKILRKSLGIVSSFMKLATIFAKTEGNVFTDL